jgi:hypothetical protein
MKRPENPSVFSGPWAAVRLLAHQAMSFELFAQCSAV